MNPLTNVKNIQKLNQRELELGVVGKKSWHDEYKDSAWIFIGGLPYDLTEGDVVCVFSQYGEIVNINLVRDKSTGKSKGYAFLCYEDQRSTVLAVDNLNSIKLLGRIIRVDHVSDYKKPKEKGDEDEVTMKLRTEGCAPKAPQTQVPEVSQLLDEPPTIRPPPSATKPKKAKKDKKKKKKKKKVKVTVKVERKSESDSSSSSNESSDDNETKRRKRKSPIPMINPDEMKREKLDKGYDRAVHGHRQSDRGRDLDEDRKPSRSQLESWERSYDKNRDEQSDRGRNRDADSGRGRNRDDYSDRDRRRDADRRQEKRHERSDVRHRERDRDGDRDRHSHQSRDRDSQHDGHRDHHRDIHDRRR